MVRTAGPGLHVRYQFIPANDRPGNGWHYASIDFELAEYVASTSLRQRSWLQAVGHGGHWQPLTVLEAELSLRSRAASRDVLRLRELGLHLEIADGWLMATDLDVAADKQAPVIADLLELWRQLSLELVGLSTD